MTIGNVAEGIVVARLAGVVHGHHRASFVGDFFFDAAGADQQRFGIHVGKNGRGPLKHHDIGGGGEGHGGNDHFVAGAHADGEHHGVQGRRAAGDGDGMGGADVRGEVRLKSIHHRASGQPIRTQGFHNNPNVILVDRLASIGNHTPSTPWASQ